MNITAFILTTLAGLSTLLGTIPIFIKTKTNKIINGLLVHVIYKLHYKWDVYVNCLYVVYLLHLKQLGCQVIYEFLLLTLLIINFNSLLIINLVFNQWPKIHILIKLAYIYVCVCVRYGMCICIMYPYMYNICELLSCMVSLHFIIS